MVTVRSSSSAVGDTAAKPTGTANQDCIVANVVTYDNAGASITPPTGFTSVRSQLMNPGGASKTFSQVFAKIAGLSEPGTYQFLGADEVMLVSCPGPDQTTPVDTGSSNTHAGSTSPYTATWTGVTVARAGSLMLCFGSNYNQTTGVPAGMTAVITDQDTVNDIFSLAVNAGATGDKTATMAADGASLNFGVQLVVVLQPPGSNAFTADLAESAISVSDAMTGTLATSAALSESSLSASDAMAGILATSAALSESALSVSDAMTGVAAYLANLTETFDRRDDFTSTLDPVWWFTVDRNGDQGNGEAQWFSPSQVSISGGKLTITAIKSTAHGRSYQSGMVQSRFVFLGGTITVGVKASSGRGTWPLLWLLGLRTMETQKLTADNVGQADWPNPGSEEIDFIEFLSADFTTLNTVIHTAAGQTGSGTSLGFDASAASHDYTLVWVPGTSLTWKVDGTTIKTISTNVPNTPMFLIVSVAMGGAGGAITDGDLPSSMQVDYIDISGAKLAVTDGVLNVRGCIADLAETALSASDAAAYQFGAAAALAESSLSVTDAVDFQSSSSNAFTFNLAETAITVSDAMTGTADYQAGLTESALSASDGLGFVFGAMEAVAEAAITASDALSYQLAALAGLSETALSASDAMTGVLGVPFALTEAALSVSDQLAYQFAAQAVLADTMLLSERLAYHASTDPASTGSSRMFFS